MSNTVGILDRFGMDTITLAGSLEAKLDAMAGAGFAQVMLSARDVVGHPGGVAAAVKVVEAIARVPRDPHNKPLKPIAIKTITFKRD